MSVSTILRVNPAVVQVYREINERRLIELSVTPGREECRCNLRLGECRTEATHYSLTCAQRVGAAAILESLIVSELVTQGARVFRPTTAQVEALEQIELNVALADYAQPYPLFCIEFPARYRERRAIIDPVSKDRAELDFVVCRWDAAQQLLVVVAYLTTSQCLVRLLWNPQGREYTLEEGLERSEATHRMFPGSLPYSEAESLVTGDAARAALNACLLLVGHGTSDPVPDNPAHIARLQRHAAAARKRGDVKGEQRSLEEMLRVPQVITFRGSAPRLYETAPANPADEKPGRALRPHWRRGHWQRFRVGPGRTGTVRKLIPAVLVNAHRLTGPPPPQSVTYLGGREDAK